MRRGRPKSWAAPPRPPWPRSGRRTGRAPSPPPRRRPGRAPSERCGPRASFVLPRRGLDLEILALAGAQDLQLEFGLAERAEDLRPELPAVGHRLAVQL